MGTLDPRFGVDAYSSRVRSLVFSSLLEVGADGEFHPYAARSWSCEFDSLVCRFALDANLFFHDGSPLTAQDVAATYSAVLDRKKASPKAALLDALVSVEAENDMTVVFRLKRATPTVGEAATLDILPARLAEGPELAPEKLVGSGPYRIVEIQDEESIRLSAFRAFQRGAPAIENLTIRVVPDALMRAMELRHGTVDLVQNAIDPDTVEWLESNAPGLQIIRGASSNFQYLGMNFERDSLSKRRVRRAIAYALDRRVIVDHLLGAQAVPAVGLLPPEHWAFEGEVKRYRHNPRRARRLLDAAGFSDPDGEGPAPRLHLSYKTTTHELRRRIAEVLVAQLAEVGIQLEVRTYEWGTFFADIRRGSFDLYTLQWVGISDPDLFRQVFHSEMMPPDGNNRGRYSDRAMDRLTEEGAEALTAEARRAAYARVQRRAARELPYIPMWWPERIVVATARLEGFRPHPSGSLLGLASANLDGQ